MAALAFAAAACGIPEEQYQRDLAESERRVQAMRAERDTCAQTLAALNDDHSALKDSADKTSQKLVTCERNIAALKSRGAELDASLTATLSKVDELEAVAQRQQAVFDKLRRALDDLVQAGSVKVAIVRGQFTVQLADKILFDSGKADVKPEARETVAELASILAAVPDRRWQVAGHTDTVGSDDFNWRLSGQRSRAVMALMIDYGLPPQSVSYAGFGPYQPTASNDDQDGRALNRRIEIVLIPDLEELLSPLGGTPQG